MEIKVLSPLMRIFCFFPRWVAARDDSGVAEVGQWTRGEAEGAAKVPVGTAAGGGGGSVGPQTT
jgi:hypothetical protein